MSYMAHKALVKPVGADPGWVRIIDAVTRLFDLRRYPELASNLSSLNERVSSISKSELGQFIGEYYHDHILPTCMEKLSKDVVEERNDNLVHKIAELWVQFYTSILPTLLAIFASVQPQQNKLSVRSLTLISFRDCVVLKTKLAAALQRYEGQPPPQIQQMLLVLQSTHRTPPDDKFFILQDMVGLVVDNYLPMVVRAPAFKSACRLATTPEDTVRSTRAETYDALDLPSDRNSSVNRSHSMGRIDMEDSPEPPVTRL